MKKFRVLVIFIIFLFVARLLPVFANSIEGNSFSDQSYDFMPMMRGMYGYYGGFGIFPLIFGGLSWILVLGGAFLLLRWLMNRSSSHTENQKALDILQQRYAKGEINKAEYEEKKKDLTN